MEEVKKNAMVEMRNFFSSLVGIVAAQDRIELRVVLNPLAFCFV
jgi:hypothetical protein